jgi:hypothetical protein
LCDSVDQWEDWLASHLDKHVQDNVCTSKFLEMIPFS